MPAVAADAPVGASLAVVAAVERMVTDRLAGEGVLVVAVAASLLLGALHALAPGHGKAVVAAYLVGQRGALRHAAALAASVALTYTVGVLVLGALLWTATVTAPERLYPVLGGASGAVIAAVGLALLLRARRQASGQDHRHHHVEGPVTGTPLKVGSLVAMGFASGMVPTPSALLVLVAALAVDRLGAGLLLVGGYGVGMAVALVALGVALAAGPQRLAVRLQHMPVGRLHALSHALPTVTAAVVVLAGLGFMARRCPVPDSATSNGRCEIDNGQWPLRALLEPRSGVEWMSAVSAYGASRCGCWSASSDGPRHPAAQPSGAPSGGQPPACTPPAPSHAVPTARQRWPR